MSVLDTTPEKAPTKRRTYKSAAERKDQILQCALEAFAARGYHRTSIADICGRARIGRATLYQYFSDKRDVLVALANRITERIVTAIEARQPLALPAGAPLPEDELVITYLQQRLAELLAVVFEDADTTRLVLRAGRGADGVVDQMLERIEDIVLARMEKELQAGVDAGLIRAIDASFVARFYLGGVEKVVLHYLDTERPVDVHAIASEVVRLEAFGILPRESTRPTRTGP